MLTKATKNLLFIFSVVVLQVLASCQKGVDIDLNNPPPLPGEIKDSTLLMESITHVWNVGMPDEDSIIEHYMYDTVNRKIILSWSGPDINEILNHTTVELKYNSKGLLSNAVYKYPTWYAPEAYDYSTIDITYDAEKVLQKTTVKFGDGSVQVKDFTKVLLSSGRYQLTWVDEEPSLPEDRFTRRFVFNADGKNIINAREHAYQAEVLPSGEFVYTQHIIEDSLVYDNIGSVVKVVRTDIDTLRHTSESHTLYEFAGRQSKGDQLYNQRQLIMSGIANVPFLDGDALIESAFGVLTFTMDYEYLQYSKYPLQQTKARMWDGSYQDFIASMEFDSKNRLTKFTGFFHDTELGPFENRIKYYK